MLRALQAIACYHRHYDGMEIIFARWHSVRIVLAGRGRPHGWASSIDPGGGSRGDNFRISASLRDVYLVWRSKAQVFILCLTT